MKRLSMGEMKAFQEDQITFIQQEVKEQGGIAALKIMWIEFIILTDPNIIREFLVRHANQVHRDPFVSPIFRRIFGNGLFVAEGKEWKRKRKLVQPAFHAMRVREYADTMASYSKEMVDSWSTDDVYAMDDQLTQLTLRIIAKTMYGVDIDVQTETIGRVMKELLGIVELQLRRSFNLPPWLPTPSNLKQKRLYKEISALLLSIIRERRAEGVDKGDLLSMLLQSKDESGQGMDDQELLDECMTLFVAGHETTAAALTWTWYVLGRNPEIASRLYDEVDTVLGKETVSFEKLKEMPYLDAVIKETMRMYPPAYGFARTVLEPFELGGHTFNKKAVVMVSTYATHHRPDLYPEPDEFRPERFLDEEPDRYAYLPFGAGPRICLGNMFAMLEAAIILVTMIQNVTLEPLSDAPATLETLVTLRPRDPVEMKVSKRPE